MADSPSSPTAPAAVSTAPPGTSKLPWSRRLASHASDSAALVSAVTLLIAISFLTVGLRNSAFTSAADPSTSSPTLLLSGFSTANALRHLSEITKSEHPLPSGANWAVRDYLIAQLNALADSPKGRERKVEVITPTPWISYPQGDALRILAPTASGGAVFLQSSNVYLRIPGRNEQGEGDRTSLLLSAHYDSVPTSKGVGDDGLGIAALLELARLAIESEPLSYSLVFNLNNGEELGLYGAHELVRHPLWKDLAAFINIDSVCPTGRPLLYRATSREMIEIFQQNAPFPHASVLGQELMNAGLIRSDTDFSVYWRAGVTGVDFAFYDRRWVYHTDLDNASILQPESLSLLGNNVASLMHGINKTGIQHIRRTPEPRNVVYTDTVGRSMFVIPYWGLATLAFLLAGVFLLVPIGVRTALKANIKSLRAGSRAVLGTMPLTGGALQLRKWAMSTLAALGALVVIVAGTVGIVLLILSIQPMAVSGRPTGVFALAILACLFMPTLIASLTRQWTRHGRINLHHGVLGLWLVLIPLVGVASMYTGFFVHVFWFGLAYVAGTLGLEVANWVSIVRFGHGGAWASAASPTEASALLARSSSGSSDSMSPTSNDEASPAASSPANVEAAPFSSDAAATSLLLPLRATWSQCLLFALSSIIPFMVALDFAFVYVYGMGFAIQEGLSPAILAGFFTLFIFPLSLNILPLLSSFPARIIRITKVLLLIALLVLGLVLTLSFPFTPDAPVKLTLRISSAFNAVLDRANTTATSPFPIAFARTSNEAQVTLGELPRRPSLDTNALLRDVTPDSCTEHACMYSAAKLGFANLPYPTANFSIQHSAPTAADPASTVITVTAPACLIFCTIGGIPAAKLDGTRVLVTSSSRGYAPTNTSFPLAAPEFRLIASNPTHQLTAQLLVPPSWSSQQWSLACRFMANDDADGVGSRVYDLYRSILARIQPHVSVTFASIGGGRALTVAEYTVVVPPVSEAVGAAGIDAGGRLSARGVWELFKGLFE